MNIIGDFHVLLLGTRGSVPIVQNQTLLYGGNTQAALVSIGSRAIIFDGGTGLLSLPSYPIYKQLPKRIDIFLSHYHLDHLIGLPLFAPFFDSECECHIYGPRHEGMDCEEILGKLFAPPFWPIALDKLPAKISFHSFDVVEEMPLGDDITLGFLPLNHPNGAFGFRLCHGGKVFCYVLDHEHTPEYNHLLSAFVRRCDLLLCDATYTAEEYDMKRGFGHSAMETMAEFAETAEVKRLLLSHHGTDKTDAMLSVLEARLHRDYPHYAFARDGMEVLL